VRDVAGEVRPTLTPEAIVEAARGLVTDAGLEALSLRRLAAKLGVTAPALYLHFTGKRELLRAMAEAEFAVLEARFAEVDTDDPLDRVRETTRAYVAHARANPELFRVMFLFPPAVGGGSADDELPAATKTFAASAANIEAAATAGAIETDDLLLTSLAMWCAAHGVATVLQLGFDFPDDLEDLLVNEVTDRLLRGYGAP
jgi:AcrR family transcriptional regulator